LWRSVSFGHDGWICTGKVDWLFSSKSFPLIFP
jgi:hypothetical protein